MCIQTEGTHSCSCQVGYELQADGKTCSDVDECEVGGYCEHDCTNSEGSYSCSCHDGYEADPEDSRRCIPVEDPCDYCSHACNEYGECACPDGFRLTSDSVTCVEEHTTTTTTTTTTTSTTSRPRYSPVDGCPPLVTDPSLMVSCSNDPTEDGTFPKGTICRGRCSIGHVADGRLKQKCRRDGTWSGTHATCVRATCPRLDLAPGVLVHPESCAQEAELPVRQRCKFSCPAGHKLLGSRATRCRRDSNWKHNGGPPKCVAIEVAASTTASPVTTTTPYWMSWTTTTTSSTTSAPTTSWTTASPYRTSTVSWGILFYNTN